MDEILFDEDMKLKYVVVIWLIAIPINVKAQVLTINDLERMVYMKPAEIQRYLSPKQYIFHGTQQSSAAYGTLYIYRDPKVIPNFLVILSPKFGSVSYRPSEKEFDVLYKQIDSNCKFVGFDRTVGVQKVYKSLHNRFYVVVDDGSKYHYKLINAIKGLSD